ncbi:MAG: cellulase family glycosylhydrolase [Planctomycetes bacterium]|nr:cellulase family glycosylhydrolase [Planctomycetota bacterium]
MRLPPALVLPALLLLCATARADDAEGVWALRGWTWTLSRHEATLELHADGRRARRVVRVGPREVILDGRWERRGDEVLVRFPRPAGLVGALAGVAPAADFTGRYRLRDGVLAGRCQQPTAGGGAAVVRERGRRTGPSAASPGAIVRTPPALEGRLRVDGTRFVDPAGRTVVLRGVNLGLKQAPFLPPHTDDALAALARATGANVARLTIAWRAVEPTPLGYDDAYLDALTATVRRLRAHGLYVLVDMHQDLWGGAMAGHGAPEWATLAADARPLPLPQGAPWQLRYLDRRVWGSFEALWADERVPATGLGLQEHYARAWARVARRLAAEDGVVGYDLMNEPFFGNEAREALARLGLAGAPLALRGGVTALVRSVVRRTSVEDELATALVELARSPDRFERLAQALAAPTQRVERRASALYGRVGAAIHREDPGRPLFLEPTGLAGVGVAPGLVRPAGLEAVVYAPHLYDAFVDTGQPWDGDLRRTARALARHVEHARRLGAPLFVGEWGNLHASSGDAARLAHETGALLDDAHAGAAYWEHRPGDEAGLLLLAMRPFPARVAGRLVRFAFDPGTRRAEVEWVADAGGGAPTVIAVPHGRYPGGLRASVRAGRAEVEVDDALGVVLVWAAGGDVTVVVEPAE